jgi:hypothetical protein
MHNNRSAEHHILRREGERKVDFRERDKMLGKGVRKPRLDGGIFPEYRSPRLLLGQYIFRSVRYQHEILGSQESARFDSGHKYRIQHGKKGIELLDDVGCGSIKLKVLFSRPGRTKLPFSP